MEQIRALWVDPGAAAYLPAALHDDVHQRRALALCGQLVTHAENTAIVVILHAAGYGDGLPDPRLRAELAPLMQTYHKLVLVFACCAPAETLPATLRPIEPPLDPKTESRAFLAERAITTYSQQR